MLIFGHKLINTNEFKILRDKINKNCVNILEGYDEKKILKLKKSGEKWALLVKNKDDLFLANALGADFILFDDEELASFASKAAEFYLFDSKILLILNELKELEKAFILGVDGVILKDFLG